MLVLACCVNVFLTTVSMAESNVPLPSPTAPFCTHCGYPQKKCINSQCGGPVLPGAPICPYCWTPQQQGAAKKCIYPQCGAMLHSIAMYCNLCNAPQDPVMFQQHMSVPNCVSCSTKLLKPGQKICHECGAIQSTQTSVVHGGQQPLPHGSQPSYYFQPSYTCPQPFSPNLLKFPTLLTFPNHLMFPNLLLLKFPRLLLIHILPTFISLLSHPLIQHYKNKFCQLQNAHQTPVTPLTLLVREARLR